MIPLSGSRRLTLVLVVASLTGVVLLAMPLGLDDYTLHVLVISFYYVVLAASWNLLAGYTGQFSLAQQGFAAIGAYTTGLLIHYYHIPIWAGILAAVVVSTLVGIGLGLMVLRLRAIYLAIATWGFAETIHIVLTAGYQVTQGQLGLAVPSLLGNLDPFQYYYVFLAMMVLCLGILFAVVSSPIGRFLLAIKDDELRASTMGVNTTFWKVFAFALTSGLSGLAGAFYAHYLAVISPDMADFSEIAKIIIMTIVGGIGSFVGPLIGAPLVEVVSQYLEQYGAWDNVILALVVILLMRFYREGLLGAGRQLFRRLRDLVVRPRVDLESGEG